MNMGQHYEAGRPGFDKWRDKVAEWIAKFLVRAIKLTINTVATQWYRDRMTWTIEVKGKGGAKNE